MTKPNQEKKYVQVPPTYDNVANELMSCGKINDIIIIVVNENYRHGLVLRVHRQLLLFCAAT